MTTSKNKPERDELGRVKKGSSLNPAGRPVIPESLRVRGPKSIAFLLDVAEGKGRGKNKPTMKERLTAAIWCAERLYGKATQSVDVGGDSFDAVVERILTGGGKIDVAAELSEPKAKK